jgi:hypothetical protein
MAALETEVRRPAGPISVGLDGGEVRDWDQKQRHFEVIVGKSVPADQLATCFGFVPTYDPKSKQRGVDGPGNLWRLSNRRLLGMRDLSHPLERQRGERAETPSAL